MEQPMDHHHQQQQQQPVVEDSTIMMNESPVAGVKQDRRMSDEWGELAFLLSSCMLLLCNLY
jgi:hypothetical protein